MRLATLKTWNRWWCKPSSSAVQLLVAMVINGMWWFSDSVRFNGFSPRWSMGYLIPVRELSGYGFYRKYQWCDDHPNHPQSIQWVFRSQTWSPSRPVFFLGELHWLHGRSMMQAVSVFFLCFFPRSPSSLKKEMTPQPSSLGGKPKTTNAAKSQGTGPHGTTFPGTKQFHKTRATKGWLCHYICHQNFKRPRSEGSRSEDFRNPTAHQ